MRILTVRQPWAWAIIHGRKDIENRVRNIAGGYRGPVAIHAAKGVGSPDEFNENTRRIARLGTPVPFGLTYGAIIGVVDLVDVHHGPEYGGGCHKLNSPLPVTPTYDLCSPWGDAGAYHLVLANPRALDEPIPYKGALGLRKTDFAVVNDYLVAPWGHGPGSCTPYGCEPWCGYEPVGRLIATTPRPPDG